MINLTNVTKNYPKEVIALDNISLEIKKGEFVSIVGQSGSGKSTLIRLLIAEEKPSAGKIVVNNWNVELIKRRHIPFFRRQIGVAFQDFKLLPKKTVYENVAFAMMVSGKPNHEIKQTVPQMLNLVGLSSKKNNFPLELSGGEQQRTAIARSLIHEPKLLLADEPTGNLDAISSWEIIELLLKINKMGTTVLMATHNREIVNRIKKRVITLDKGKIVRDQKIGGYTIC